MSLDDIPFVDTFYPTEKEFSDFQAYVNKVDLLCRTGIMKVTQI